MKYTCLFLFAVFMGDFSHAQDSLNVYLKIASQNNPALKAKYSKYLASLQKVPQVGALPDPDLSFGYFIEPMEVLGGKQRAQIQLMQMFPWAGTLKAAKNEATQMAQSDFEAFRAEKDELWMNVRKNFYQLWFISRQIAVNDSSLILLKSTEQLLLSKLRTDNGVSDNAGMPARNMSTPATGNSSMSMSGNATAGNASIVSSPKGSGMGNVADSPLADLLTLRNEIATLENTVISLKQRQQVMQTQFNLLLNRDVAIPVSTSEPLPALSEDYRSPALFDSIRSNNPMLQMSKSDIEAYRYRQIMNRKMGYPMVGIGINYTVVQKSEMSSSSMNGKDMIMPMLSVKLPVYRKKYAASVKEARLLEQSATENAANIQNMLFMELTDAQLAIDEAERTIRLMRLNLDLATQTFNLKRVRLSVSGNGLDELLRAHRSLLDYHIAILQGEVDKQIGYAALWKLLSK